jgi:hypothetical protein
MTDISSNIRRIDEENDEFFKESIEDVLRGKMTVKDILGFDVKKPAVLIPSTSCGHLAPSVASYCSSINEKPATSIFTLLPMYDALVYPIQAKIGGNKVSESNFHDAHDISVKDFLNIIDKGRIIPFFSTEYCNYDTGLMEHFLEPGRPRISRNHMTLIERINTCSIFSDCKSCNQNVAVAKKDIIDVLKKPAKGKNKDCYRCLARAYGSGITKDQILQLSQPAPILCLFGDIVASRNLGGVFKSNCPLALEALGLFSCFSKTEKAVDTIVSGLRVKYTTELDLESYLSVLDGKTTRAVREVVKKILEDPYAAKYSEVLNSKIFEFNRELRELAASRSAAFYEAVSEIAVYGGTKFAERQTQGLLKSSGKNLRKVEEWVASKLMDVHARVTGKDWTIAQLYKARCKIEQCRKQQTTAQASS